MKDARRLLGNSLSLEAYRKLAKYDPWAFWGWDCACNCGCSGGKSCSKCQDVLRGYYWQANSMSRDDVYQAIADAEDKARQLNRIPVGRQYFEEVVDLPQHFDGKMQYVQMIDQLCRWSAVQLCNNYVRRLGTPTYTLLCTAVVTYFDSQGNDPWENSDEPTCPVKFEARCPMPTPAPDLDEVQAHFATGNRVNPQVNNDSWIDMVTTYYDAATGELVITGPAWLMGNPQHWEVNNCPLECLNRDSYVNTLELYQFSVVCGTTVETACALLISEGRPCGCGCCHNAPPICGQSAVPTCGGVRIGKSGLAYVADAVYNAETGTWGASYCKCCQSADKVCIRYEAGIDYQSACNGRYDLNIAKLATGLLPELCHGCCPDHSYFRQWSTDIAERDRDGDDRFAYTFNQLDSPWGTTKGALAAYSQLSTIAVGRGAVIL